MIKTGGPGEIDEPSKHDRIKKMGKINGDPESLAHMDWSQKWKGEEEI